MTEDYLSEHMNDGARGVISGWVVAFTSILVMAVLSC